MSKKTKIVSCICCGIDIEVSLFMSAKKAKCNECKGSGIIVKADPPQPPTEPDGVHEEFAVVPFDEKLKTVASLPPIQHILDTPMEKNKSLSRLCCPHHTDVVLDTVDIVRSTLYGDVISMMCPVCFTIVQISEPHQYPQRKKVDLIDEVKTKDERAKLIVGALHSKTIAERHTIEEEIKWIRQLQKL